MSKFLDDNYEIIFPKFSNSELVDDIIAFKYGKSRLSKILTHYFKEEIFKCRGNRGKLTPMEALQDEEVLKEIFSIIEKSPQFYAGNDVANVESFFRNAGRIATKVANFDPINVHKILLRLGAGKEENKVVLDTSAGFGARMCATLLGGDTYIGIDPNKSLQVKLNECFGFLKKNRVLNKGVECKLYCQGSETFIPELENTVDVMFTSPPYFDLEIYSNDGCASSSNIKDYDQWLSQFVRPTLENVYRYLKVGGVAAINIKNLTRGGYQPLFNDFYKTFKSIDGYKIADAFEIKHQSKKALKNTNYDIDKYTGFKEPVMVFKKVATGV